MLLNGQNVYEVGQEEVGMVKIEYRAFWEVQGALLLLLWNELLQ